MRLRALGTGSPFCRHPLVTSSFLLQADSGNTVIGCGPNIPSKLEAISLHANQVDLWVLLHPGVDQIGGLIEVAALLSPEQHPYLSAPETVIREVRNSFQLLSGKSLDRYFSVRSTRRVVIEEEHSTETLSFVENYLHDKSFGLLLEEAKIFISGSCELNEEFLHRYGSSAEIILHQARFLNTPHYIDRLASVEELQTLPMYLQSKIWLYGYHNDYQDLEEPLPMLLLPQGSCIFDSSRKDRHLSKERFIREISRRLLGNQP